MDTSDAFCIRECLAGNTDAFAPLVERYRDLVYGLAFKVLNNSEWAQEVAQEVFVRAFEKLDGFQGKSSLSTWLYTITYRLAIDALRKRKKELRLQDGDGRVGFEAVDPSEELEEDREDLARAVKNVIAKLPEKDAALVFLYYYDELSVAEIAVITRTTKMNVKVRLHRIRKKLATMLKQVAHRAIVIL